MENIERVLMNYLSTAKRATIWLEQLEKLFVGESIAYEQFAEVIHNMEKTMILSEIRSAGRTLRTPSLAYRYRIHKHKLKLSFQQRLLKLRLQLHPSISLERYFSLGEEIFDMDAPYITLIDQYLQKKGLPDKIVAAPERSYELVSDEKWITEKNGKALLQRIDLWDKLFIVAEYDPLMFAINPRLLSAPSRLEPCLHFIVENKTTFQALLPALIETDFQSLIYGCGNKIVGNIGMFSKQFPLPEREHYFYYFGDIDHKGIQIWHDLSAKIKLIPATPFYHACLQKKSAKGKEYQRKEEYAFKKFLTYFSEGDRAAMEHALSTDRYYPQEILTTQELLTIWRNTPWRELK